MKDEIESQVIEEGDIGSADEILDLDVTVETIETPESVPEVEVEGEVADIEMGKVPDNLKSKFMSMYKLLESMSTIVDHSPTSKRYHFKVKKENGGKKGIGLLFYGRKPKLVLNFAVEGQKKQRQVYYNITEKAVIGPDEETLTVKEIQKIVRKFKRDRGI